MLYYSSVRCMLQLFLFPEEVTIKCLPQPVVYKPELFTVWYCRVHHMSYFRLFSQQFPGKKLKAEKKHICWSVFHICIVYNIENKAALFPTSLSNIFSASIYIQVLYITVQCTAPAQWRLRVQFQITEGKNSCDPVTKIEGHNLQLSRPVGSC